MKKIGIVGIGAISGIYLKNITQTFKNIEIIGVCDLIRERAEKAVAEYNIPKLYNDMHELFADPEVDIVLNLTRPYEHYEVTKAALMAGKPVYSEKPLGASLEEGEKLVALAKEKGLWIAGAPDTYMGAGIQTCRRLIDSGAIGSIVGASAFMVLHGHESWHPDPAFYYQYGGGPMMDMGPYYVTALVNLIGGVRSVCGKVRTTFPTRTITSQPHAGEVVKVEVPTTIYGVMEFDNGAVGSILTSFDIHSAHLPIIEIYGSEGTIWIPDPNTFGGPVRLRKAGQEEVEIPLEFPYDENSRALGLSEMANALEEGREPRTSYNQTLHVLEIMTGFARSCETGKAIELSTKYTRKLPMNPDAPFGLPN